MPALAHLGDHLGATDVIHVDCWFRTDPAPEVSARQRTIYARLLGYRRAGVIDSLDVHRWPKRISPADAAEGETPDRVWYAFQRFAAWADRHGCRLEPAFRPATEVSPTGEALVESIRLPVTCLAITDDDLLMVYPCSTPDGCLTVDDGLDVLEHLRRERHRSGRPPAQNE